MFRPDPKTFEERRSRFVEKIGGLSGNATGGTAVIISTRGRPEIVGSLVRQLGQQTMRPDHIFVVAAGPDDIAELSEGDAALTLHVGRPGLTSQRNDGLKLAGSRFSYIVFFDDDFVPSRFWIERMTRTFEARPDIVGMTGTILADGTLGAGIDLAEANAMVARNDADADRPSEIQEKFAYGSNVGCNMAYRYSTLRGITFDERLPLYAWHEDSDVRGQVERRGPFVRTDALWGVHLGHKQGRLPGLRLGYSQVANVAYLARKGTVPSPFLLKVASKNLMANLVRSVRPEPFVDRRGRLRGNLIGIGDLIRGRLKPERILTM
jgi:glycosyltransferase involved in cell wall biosynthesis